MLDKRKKKALGMKEKFLEEWRESLVQEMTTLDEEPPPPSIKTDDHSPHKKFFNGLRQSKRRRNGRLKYKWESLVTGEKVEPLDTTDGRNDDGFGDRDDISPAKMSKDRSQPTTETDLESLERMEDDGPPDDRMDGPRDVPGPVDQPPGQTNRRMLTLDLLGSGFNPIKRKK